MSTTTTDRTDHDDPPTAAIPHHRAPAEPGWLDQARAWLPSHEGGDYGGVDVVLLVLYVVAQAYASVNLVQLALWADHSGVASGIPAVLIDGSALVLAAIFADRSRGALIRLAAAVLSLLLFVTSVAGTGLNELVHRRELAAYWSGHKADVSLALAVAPTVLVGVLIVMRLVIAAARRSTADAAAEAQRQQNATAAAAHAEAEQERERQRLELEAWQRQQDELEAEHRRALEVAEQERAAADDEVRRQREDADRQRQLEQDAADTAHRRALELEAARREADEAAAAQRRDEEVRAEQRAARDAKRAERDEQRAAAATAPARKAAPAPGAEPKATRGRRFALRHIVEQGACPKAPRVCEAMDSTDPKAGKRVLQSLEEAGLVGEAARDGARSVRDLEGCRAALADLGADPAAPQQERELHAV